MSDVNTAVESAQPTQPESSTGELNSAGVSGSSSEMSVEEALDKAFNEGISEAEQKPSQKADTDKAETQDDEPETEESEQDTEEATESEEKDKSGGAEARKEALNQEIRDLVATRNRYKEEIARYQEMQLPTVEDLTAYIMSQDEDISERDARTEALMRLNEAQNHRQNQIETIAETRQEIDLAVVEAARDFPEIFDSKHASFNRDLAAGIMEMYEEMAGVQRASDGGIVEARVKLGPFLQSIGRIYQLGQQSGKEMAEKSTKSQRRQQIRQAANPYPSSQKATPTPPTDPYLEGFDGD